MTNSSTNPQTISVPVSLNSTQPINAASGDLIFRQNINNNGNTATFAGTGNTALNGGAVVLQNSGAIKSSFLLIGNTSGSNAALYQAGSSTLVSPGYSLGGLQVGSAVGGFGAGTLKLGGPVLYLSFDSTNGTTVVNDGTNGSWLMHVDAMHDTAKFMTSFDLTNWSSLNFLPGPGNVIRHGTVIRDDAFNLPPTGLRTTPGNSAMKLQ